MFYFVLKLVLVTCVFAYDEGDGDGFGEAFMDLYRRFGGKLFSQPNYNSGTRLEYWNHTSGTNPEEIGDYAEGDILFPNVVLERNALATAQKWSRGIVPYVVAGYFSYEGKQMLDQAFNEYARLTCVRFVPRSSESDYLYITSENTGCWSSVGRLGGRQQLNLQNRGCLSTKGTVIHELMHALGFMHEQNRWERDRYISINYQNIVPGTESNFEKKQRYATDGQGIEYDYGSVMHYSAYAFSRNGQPTITPRASGVTLGQRVGLSRRDVKKIRRFYRCKGGKSYA